MTGLLRVHLLVAGLAIPSFAAEVPTRETTAANEIPPILHANLEHVDPEFPIWISAEAAVTPSGELDPKLFHPHFLSALVGILSTPLAATGRCIEFGPVYEEYTDPPWRNSIATAVEHSDLVFVGRVMGRDYGFDRGVPGQLLRVEPLEKFKGALGLEFYFVFIPVGEFWSGPFHICKTDPRYPESPSPGDSILLMIPEQSAPNEPYLDLQFDTALIAFDENGGSRLPRAIASNEQDPNRSFSKDSVLAMVKNCLESKRSER